MRFTIYKNHQGAPIGHINFDDMTITLLRALIALDYTVEIEPIPQPTKEGKQ